RNAARCRAVTRATLGDDVGFTRSGTQVSRSARHGGWGARTARPARCALAAGHRFWPRRLSRGNGASDRAAPGLACTPMIPILLALALAWSDQIVYFVLVD